MKLEMYGHYYRMFKGTGGVPTKVTVVGIEGDTVTLVRGHYTKEDFEERSEDLDEAIRLFCLTKMKCNKDKILTSLTPKQQRLVAAMNGVNETVLYIAFMEWISKKENK